MKFFIKYSVLALIFLVAGVMIFLLTLDINQYKPTLEQLVSQQTGREFSIQGDLELTPSLTPTIAVSGLRLGNPDWAGSGNMVEVGRVEAILSLMPLLSGQVEVSRFILHDTRIALEKNTDGTGNWVLQPATESGQNPAATGTGGATLPTVQIGEIDIRNAVVSYRDRATGADPLSFELRRFSTAVTSLDEPLTFELEAAWNQIPLELAGTVGAANTLLAGSRYPVDIQGSLGALNLNLSGELGNAMAATDGNLTFRLQTPALNALDDLAGQALPDLRPVSIGGRLLFATPENPRVEDMEVTVGPVALRGQAAISTAAAVPSITARFTADTLDLTPFIPETPEEEAPEFLFSRDPLPLDALQQVNADIGLVIGKLILPGLELNNNNLTLSLQQGRLKLDNRAGLAGGQLAASMDMNGSAKADTASLSTEISGVGILLEQLPHDEDRWFTGGLTDIQIQGRGQGNSVAAIMGSFNGNILVKVGEATLPNDSVDFFGADILLSTFNKLNPLAGKDNVTLLECAVVNLPVNDGLIKLDRQIAIQTSKMYLVGSGEINLKTEALNLGMRPYAKEGTGINLSTLAGAARVGGTLARPGVEIDAANAVQAGVSAGAAMATGGLSLLAQGLFNRAGTDPAPCNTALGITSAPAESATPQPAGSETSDGRNVLDGVKNQLRGLFGR